MRPRSNTASSPDDYIRVLRSEGMGGRMRVAIVDDDESVRKALHRLLRSAGIDSECFDGGAAFFQRLATERPDCILLDVSMPDLDGEDVLQRLAAMRDPVPTILITAHEGEGAALQARFPAIVTACRIKPLNDDTLLSDIRAAVGQVHA